MLVYLHSWEVKAQRMFTIKGGKSFGFFCLQWKGGKSCDMLTIKGDKSWPSGMFQGDYWTCVYS